MTRNSILNLVIFLKGRNYRNNSIDSNALIIHESEKKNLISISCNYNFNI